MIENVEIAEELTSSGVASGVEIEQIEPEGGIEQPFDPEKIDVVTRIMTVDLLVSRFRHSAIDLEPEFQRRRGIWTEQRQSRLLESLLLRIPLPTFYAAEDENESWIIVDGIQRLTAIYRFIEPDLVNEPPLRLSNLEYLGTFESKLFSELPPRLQRRIKETELVIHLIRNGTPEEAMFNIFGRINTGGLPLSNQELRHALIKGKARSVLKEWAASPEFQSATDHSIRDERMADREMILRFIAFRLQPEPGSADFDEFLRTAMKRVNQLPPSQLEQLGSDLRAAMETARAIFDNDAFRKRYQPGAARFPVNKALFESISVNLARLKASERQLLVKRRDAVQQAFIALSNDRNFDSAISQGTGAPAKVKLRFERVAQLFQKVLQ